MNYTQPCPSLPDPQDIQKPTSPGARAPDPRLHRIPSLCIDHSLGEGVALFEVLLLKWGERKPRSLKGPRGEALRQSRIRGDVIERGKGLQHCRPIFQEADWGDRLRDA